MKYILGILSLLLTLAVILYLGKIQLGTIAKENNANTYNTQNITQKIQKENQAIQMEVQKRLADQENNTENSENSQ